MSVLPVSDVAIDEATEWLRVPGSARAFLPCVYCRADIAADDFEFWTAAHRLLSATCPHCHRRVTLAAITWRRWTLLASAPVLEASVTATSSSAGKLALGSRSCSPPR